jgi:hypothetical protein
VFFLNLSAAEVLALLSGASALVVALYLFDRARRKIRVATLRFWVEARQPVPAHRRTRIQQPWSLLLQLLGIALLLLAIGQLQFGPRAGAPFDHVLILDTSSWMAARQPGTGGGQLIDQVREQARAYVRALPRHDRVMLVRADALATPATAFESSRARIEAAIAQSAAGVTALNLQQALEFGRQAQRLGGGRAGEIVFIGAGRMPASASAAGGEPAPPNLRFIRVADSIENAGLRRIELKRPPSAPDTWQIYVSAKNYGVRPRATALTLLFGGAPVGSQQLTLPPGGEREASFTLRTAAAGVLEARLVHRDGFPLDDRVSLELPAQRRLRVAVYTGDPASLRPLLEADPRLSATFRRPDQYEPRPEAEVLIVDGFRPNAPPALDAIWINPPDGGPLALRQRVQNARLIRWNSDHPLGAGLRSKDWTLASAAVLVAGPEDIRVAETEAGPVIVARAGRPRAVVLGFDPARSPLRFELATPLLFANAFRWLAPDIFRREELSGGSVGTVRMAVDRATPPEAVRVAHEDGAMLPFTLQNGVLTFFAGTRGRVSVSTGDREVTHSLTLPEVGDARWEPPPGVRRGVPPAAAPLAAASDLWPWLALAGGLVLLLEWLLYGRRSAGFRRARKPAGKPARWLAAWRTRRSES